MIYTALAVVAFLVCIAVGVRYADRASSPRTAAFVAAAVVSVQLVLLFTWR